MLSKSHHAAHLLKKLLALAAAVAASGALAADMLAIEGEALVAKAKPSAGKVSAQPMAQPGWSGNSHLLWSGGAAGAALELAIDVPAAAQYAMELYLTRAPDYAQLAIEVDGKPSSVAPNGYAPRLAAPSPTQIGKFPLQAGQHTLTLKITGKAAQSSGYLVGVDLVKLYPAGALADQGGSGGSLRRAAPAKAPASQPSGSPKEQPPQAPSKQPGAGCDSTCTGNVATVYRQAAGGGCQVWFRFPCSPYGCDSALGLCLASCSSNSECAQGAVCDTSRNLCASASTMCSDAFNVKMPNGQTQSCAPFKCVGGACNNVCTSPGDCAPGYTCNTTTAVCIPSPKKK
jgi:hypothetical protein